MGRVYFDKARDKDVLHGSGRSHSLEGGGPTPGAFRLFFSGRCEGWKRGKSYEFRFFSSSIFKSRPCFLAFAVHLGLSNLEKRQASIPLTGLLMKD